MKSIISADKLCKQYHIGSRPAYKTLRESIMNIVSSASLSWKKDFTETIWALKDVSFNVHEGEVLGIIGKNGSGKSTLLKILSRITDPTEGEARIRGRVASLLEVGTGFHPELTGRENVFLNGAILGMSKAEIRKKFDEIVAFAEVEKFLDTPVKHYSSGMYVRLAFAVAAHLEPEILIVDEVLAVGDAQFQKKCLGKMGDVARDGRTVLFVSHNMAAVENLCQRAILLHNGLIDYIGITSSVIDRYLSRGSDNHISLLDRVDRLGTGSVKVYSVEIRDEKNNVLHEIRSGQSIDIVLYYEMQGEEKLSNVIAGISVQTFSETPLFLQHNRLTRQDFGILPQKGAIICRINRLPLPPSSYRLTYSLIRDGVYLDKISNACQLIVIEGNFFGSGEVPPISHGVCLVDANWRVERL